MCHIDFLFVVASKLLYKKMLWIFVNLTDFNGLTDFNASQISRNVSTFIKKKIESIMWYNL